MKAKQLEALRAKVKSLQEQLEADLKKARDAITEIEKHLDDEIEAVESNEDDRDVVNALCDKIETLLGTELHDDSDPVFELRSAARDVRDHFA